MVVVCALAACGAPVAPDRPDAADPIPAASVASAPLAVALAVRPAAGSVTIDVTVTATGTTDVEPALFASVLEVDGQPWPSWSLVVGNGTIDESSLLLQPGETTTLQRVLPPTAFPPGDHTAVLRTAGASSPPAVFRIV